MVSSDVDSMRAWFVAVCAHICIMIHDGLTKALGVMIPEITQAFNTYAWVIGLIIALMPSVGSLTSLSAGPLSERFSTRSIVMTCGCLGSTGLLISSLATQSATGFGVVLVALTGIPLRLSFVMSLSLLGHYFSKYYASANSLALMGVSTGVMTFAPLAQHLLTTYGWRGALLILAGTSSHVVLCGAFMKQVSYNKEQRGTTNSIEDGNHDVYKEKNADIGTNTSLVKSHEKLDKFGLRLFRDARFPILLAATFADLYVWTGWVVYLVPHAKGKGLIAYKATSLATAGGVGNLLGKIVIPLLIDNKKITPRTVLLVGLVLSGISLLVDSFVSNFAVLISLSCIFGFTNGTTILAIFILVKDVAGPLNLAKAMPWIFLVSGAARMLAGFSVGWMFELTGSYNFSWIILGAMCFVAAVIMALESIYQYLRCMRR